jgi:dephospho-CoA kinase
MFDEINQLKNKNAIITLIGMSGAGKTTLSNCLEENGWKIFSVDYYIGKKLPSYLSREVTVDDLSSLSEFLGHYTVEDAGEFRRRHNIFREAEIEVMYDVLDKARKSPEPCVIDTSGSFCELEDLALYDCIGRSTQIVYLDVSEAKQTELFERALKNPKPLYYPSDFFEKALKDYNDSEQDRSLFEFMFPRLFISRLPKYKWLVEEYNGISIDILKIGAGKRLVSLPRSLQHL